VVAEKSSSGGVENLDRQKQDSGKKPKRGSKIQKV
jgi:hypothetical protein